jgi:uncharacterized membrane protein YfcA
MLHLSDSSSSTLLLFGVALLAGVINGVAGGGGLILFPTLLFTGMAAIPANATNTASLWFGTAGSTVAYRKELLNLRRELLSLTATSLFGGILGAHLLLHTPQARFTALIPYLMLTATLLFACGRPLIHWLRKRDWLSSGYRLPLVVAMLLQFGIAIYIGFFGGGAGIVIMAMLDLMGLKNIHAMNAVKTWLASCTNGVAVIAFMAAHTIVWPEAILMAIAALIGGYGSAHLARRLHPAWVRGFVISVGGTITIYFFCK